MDEDEEIDEEQDSKAQRRKNRRPEEEEPKEVPPKKPETIPICGFLKLKYASLTQVLPPVLPGHNGRSDKEAVLEHLLRLGQVQHSGSPEDRPVASA